MSAINDASGGYRIGGYREYAAPQALRRFAEVAWSYETPPGASTRACHRVIPETGVSVCLFARRLSTGGLEDVRSGIMGSVLTPRLFRPMPGHSMFGVRLRPEWCQHLLGLAPWEHTDAVDPLPRPLAASVAHLARGGDTAPHTIVAGLLALVGARSERARPDSRTRLAHRVLERVRRGGSTSERLSDLARDAGVSARHLRRAVQGATGLAPKYFQRVRRLHVAVSLAEPGDAPNWATVALCAGFHDQAHMIREFRTLTTRTPVQLRRERLGQRGA